MTRADEFKKNHEAPFDDANFDSLKAEAFLNELGQRINQLFNGFSYIDSNSIILINNKPKFRIEQLAKIILDHTDSSSHSQVNLHSHKIIYFQSSAEKLKLFFCNFLLKKLYTLAEIIRVSQDNIERFRGKIRLTNNQLTESWNKNAESIRAKEYEVLEQLRNIAEPTESVSNFCSLASENNLLVDMSYLKNEASNRVNQITIDVRYKLLKQFKKEARTKNDRVNNLDSLSKLEEPESFNLNFIDYQKDTLLKSLNFLPPDTLVSVSRGIIRESDNQLLESYKELQKAVNILKNLIIDQKPIKNYQLILSSSIRDLHSDFDTYFDSITVYRSGVFALI